MFRVILGIAIIGYTLVAEPVVAVVVAIGVGLAIFAIIRNNKADEQISKAAREAFGKVGVYVTEEDKKNIRRDLAVQPLMAGSLFAFGIAEVLAIRGIGDETADTGIGLLLLALVLPLFVAWLFTEWLDF